MTEETIIKKLTELLNSISDESGIQVRDMDIFWINLDDIGKPEKRVSHINLKISSETRDII